MLRTLFSRPRAEPKTLTSATRAGRLSTNLVLARAKATAFLSFPALLLTLGCGSEVGRVAFAAPGPAQTTATLDSGKEVDFWTDLDVEWEGDLVLQYLLRLEQGGKVVAAAVCNPLDVTSKVGSLITNIGNSHTRSYSGKMRCSTRVPESGLTTIHASFTAVPKPAKLTKFDLVIKQ